jgi:uncharacterized protein YggE
MKTGLPKDEPTTRLVRKERRQNVRRLKQVWWLVSLLLVAATGTTFGGEEGYKPGPPLVMVNAEGQVLAVPDIAKLQVVIVTEAPQAQAAAAENAKKAEAFVSAAKKFLQPQDSLKSMGYRIVPLQTYGERGKKPAITGYRVSNNFQITIKDLSRLGDLIDLAVRQGVNEMYGPFWEHAKIDALTQEASVQALQKAKELAAALAASQGLKIKRLHKVSTRGRSIPVPREEGRMIAAAPGSDKIATPMEVGEQEIRAAVDAVFELE